MFTLSIAVVILSQQATKNNLLWAVDVRRTRNDLRNFGTILELVNEDTRLMQRLQDGLYRFGILLSKFSRKCADFFWMVEPQRLGRRHREADFVRYSTCIPRLPHTEAVHFADFHVGYHLWRWDSNQ